ncbi:hypothetical protein D3C86_2240250 [compost metagenome]
MGLAVEQGQRQIATGQQFFELCATFRVCARHDEVHAWAHGTQTLGSIKEQCAEPAHFSATTAGHQRNQRPVR